MRLLSVLEESATAGQLVALRKQDARPAGVAGWPAWVSPQVISACASHGVPHLWKHQVRAANLIHAGTHTVVATGTGSGKSLAAWVPALTEMLGPRSSTSLARVSAPPTVLYLSPTKALAADQYTSLRALARDVDSRITVATADGDADSEEKTFARDHADIVLTNPDFVHHAMLPQKDRWQRIWRGLRMVVVDEFHSYKGLFGAHVGHVVRRILRIAALYGSRPTVVFLSATAGEPQETATRFIGTAFGPVEAVTDDASPRGERTIALWQCSPVDDDETGHILSGQVREGEGEIVRRSATVEAADLTARFVAEGARVLTFVRSRAGTERVAGLTQEFLRAEHKSLAQAVAAYRGGYLPEERRDLEKRLRSGALRAVATTNALELGIDISGLDAVILTGWPGTTASFNQQAGRAGRAGSSGLAVFIGTSNPLDQYLLAHPDTVLSAGAEASVFDPLNPNVLTGQVCAAAAEHPLNEGDAAIFGLPDTSLFDDLSEQGLLRRRPGGWFWGHAGISAHELVNLRGEASTVSIVDEEDGNVLGTVDATRADTTVYPGAIYIHQGIPFDVQTCDGEVATVRHRPQDDLRTFAAEETTVKILRSRSRTATRLGTWAWGDVEVFNRVVGYHLRRARDGMYLGFHPITPRERSMETCGTWWTMASQDLEALGIPAADVPGALHAAEHAAIGILPLFAICDRWDVGGLSTAYHPDTGAATVIVHDAAAGGSGCAERGYRAGRQWIRATRDAVAGCPCQNGCPRCVQSPKCGNNNDPLWKEGAVLVLSALSCALDELEVAPPVP